LPSLPILQKKMSWLVFSSLLLAGMFIYASPRWHYFHSDEVVWFRALQNESFHGLLWREFWTGSPWDYRPLKSLYLFSLHRVLGDWPEGFHAANLLLHVGSATLLYFLALRLGLQKVPAGLAAVLFLVHPAPYQTVRWVIDCSTLLQVHFMLWALLLLFVYFDRGKTRHLLLSLFAAIAAMYAKESGVVAVVLLPVADCFLRPSLPWKRLKVYWPVPVMLALFLLLSSREMPGWREHIEGYRIGIHLFSNMAYSLGFLVSLPKHFGGPISWTCLLGGVLLLSAIYSPADRRTGLVLAAWLLLAALPTTLFIHQGSYDTTGRHSYAWLAPFALVMAFLFQRLIQTEAVRDSTLLRSSAVAAVILVLVAIGVTTSRLAATPYETHAGPILYHYVALSQMNYQGADRYLTAELGCPTVSQLHEATVWGQKIKAGDKEQPVRAVQGELVSGLSLAILGQRQEARLKFNRALQVLEARTQVQLVRGASLPLPRTRRLTQGWLQSPPVSICNETANPK
jgi:hypothetical protein